MDGWLVDGIAFGPTSVAVVAIFARQTVTTHAFNSQSTGWMAREALEPPFSISQAFSAARQTSRHIVNKGTITVENADYFHTCQFFYRDEWRADSQRVPWLNEK